MSQIKTVEGDFSNANARYAVLVGRFNSFVVESLVSGAIDTLRRHGVSESNITIVRAPGAWELPLVAKKLVATGNYDAVIALGAVIRGGTPHFESVASEVNRAISRISLDTGVPVIQGIITADTLEQAIERAGAKEGNRGFVAASSAIEMANLLKAIG